MAKDTSDNPHFPRIEIPEKTTLTFYRPMGEAVAIEKMVVTPKADKAKSVPPVISPPFISLPSAVQWASAYPALSQGSGLPSAGKSAVLAHNFETGADVLIGQEERCGGLYILGQPRTGKSNLLVSLALQDIKQGCGVLFIDPHTDAIAALDARIPESRKKDRMILDPTDRARSFGINLLECSDNTDPLAIEDTWARVRDIFVKVWGDERGQLGVWLEKILRNCVYLLVENPACTLVDIPLILDEDTSFRNYLLANVKANPYIRDFWFREFDRLTRREKTEQVGPALSRLDIFMGNATIRHIVGQGKTTVDFNKILNGEGSQRIVLLRMPVYLSQEVKAIVGTMILSQVVHAAFNRDKLPEGKRRYFGIYCDEFQEFATPDFARLFTQTGKFKVMPAVAHQTRLGQFAPGDPNQGATLTAPNKVLFSLSVHDAQELALEFAGEPPTETRLEEQLVISQYPVRDLLQGHTNAQIRWFVNQYLRYLHDRREDAREDMEGERLLRLGDLDDATLYGVDERLAGVTDPSFYDKQIESLGMRSLFLMSAKERTAKIRDLHETSKRLRLTIRALNRVLTDVMEGTCREGQEAFSDFLIGLAGSYSRVPENYTKLLELYISVKYGDRHARRVVPFAFADRHRMFELDLGIGYAQSEFKRIETDKRNRKRISDYWEGQRQSRERDKRYAESDVLPGLRNYKLWIELPEVSFWYVGPDTEKVLTSFVPICAYPFVHEALRPFFTCGFASPWKERMQVVLSRLLPELVGAVQTYRRQLEASRREGEAYWPWLKFSPALLDSFERFLETHGQKAFVPLFLMWTIHYPTGWIYGKYVKGYGPLENIHWFNALNVPSIPNLQPLSVLTLLEDLSDKLSERRGSVGSDCRKFYLTSSGEDPYVKFKGYDRAILYEPFPRKGIFREEIELGRTDLDIMRKVFEGKEWKEYVAREESKWWSVCSALTKTYLAVRACDMIRFGTRVADITFPQPDIQGASWGRVRGLVDQLVICFNEAEKYRNWSPALRVLPEALDARVLSVDERNEVINACEEEFNRSEPMKAVVGTVAQFASFCDLLSKPENHIKVRSAQYVDKPVRSRTEIDMVNETARELVGLPKFIAYARVTQNILGEQKVWKGKIKTVKV